jgi:hypothetical protein
MDRWYAQFILWNDIKAAGSSYVCRVRDNSVYDVIKENPVDQAATDAGVISDQIVVIGLSKSPDQRANHTTRLICIKSTPHHKPGKTRHGGSHGPTSNGTLRIVTENIPTAVDVYVCEIATLGDVPEV